MNEYTIGYTAFGSLIGLALMCLLYMLGGRNNKGIRRFGASFVQTLNNNICSIIMNVWNPILLLIYPIVAIGLSFGYGGEEFLTKLIRRSIFCMANLGVGVLYLLKFGLPALGIFIPNLGIAIWSIYLGIKNPLYAAAEEVFVCAVLYLMTCAYPFIVGLQ